MKISLCLIVKNELKGCQQDIPKIPQNEFFEIFAIDGGSTDGTVEYLHSMGIRVEQQPQRGLNAAYVHANRVAMGDAIISFFPKGTLPISDLKKFRPQFEQGAQLVIASRQLPSSINEEDDQILRPRKWAVYCLAIAASLIWRREGNMVKDVLHGFKGWTKDSFVKMQILDYGLSIDIEMVIRSYKLKLTRTEFPTEEQKRTYGESNFRIWPTGKKLLAYIWFELFRRDS